jgi:SAM-dependent methyltransferase
MKSQGKANMIAGQAIERIREKTLLQIAAATGKTLYYAVRSLLRKTDRPLFRQPDIFDSQWGTDTESWVPLSRLEFPSEMSRNCTQYEASSSTTLTQAIELADIDPADFSMIDVGSGKGRIVLSASAMHFRRAIGVEYSRKLVSIAHENARIFGERGGSRIESEFHCCDAREYPWPDGPLFIYLFNPFGPILLVPLIEALEQTMKRERRRIIVAYSNPCHIAEFDRRHQWSQIAEGDDLVVLQLGQPTDRRDLFTQSQFANGDPRDPTEPKARSARC